MTANVTDPMIGRLIDGRYQVRSRIARGGMATVYLATDLRLERRVAVKVMHGHLADDSQFKQRFIQEARSAARLAHPNVVNVFDQGQDSDSAYLVMEYLPGITLRDLLEEYGSLTPQQTIDITEAVLSGLGAAHKAGIVHRDLKPENVLLADDGRIKIGDFGLARAATANTATGAQLLGTIAYLSPELVTRGLADTRSDIYAVGIMMYEMLTGEQPFTGEQPMQIAYRHANEPVPPASAKNPRVPHELDDLVSWATAKDPDQRPADARALLEQLRDTEAVLDLPSDTPVVQKTRVLPASRPRHTGPAGSAPTTPIRPDRGATGPTPSDAETQVLGSRRAPGTALAVSEARSRGRQPRRWIPATIILGVLVLAGLTVGWWFAFGPGARVTIPPSIQGKTVEEARAILDDLGFEVAEETRETTDPVIPVDTVAGSDPAVGTSVEPGSTITLLVSIGPELLSINLDQGMPQGDAEAIVTEHWTLEPIDERFDPDIPAGQLIDALDADGESLLDAAEYGELQPITLVVSVGKLPAVRGESFESATAILAAVGLATREGEKVFHDEIPSGQVVRVEATDPDGDALIIRPGDTVALSISKGPDLVQVPAIEGMTWTEAKQMLADAGLTYAFDRNIDEGLAENFPDDAEVTDADPSPGSMVLRGSVVTVRLGV